VSARRWTRWRAAGLHLLASSAIAAPVAAAVLWFWYPPPYFDLAGGRILLGVLLVVLLGSGPLLTLLVFRPGKPGLRFDLEAIALVQTAAFLYGCSILIEARPAFVVFVKDRFELVTAGSLEPNDLAEAQYPEFRHAPWTGPLLAAADLPEDPEERQRLIKLAAAGLDAQHFPRYYAPYAVRTAQVLARAATVARLRAEEPAIARAVDAWLAASGTPEDAVRCLLMQVRDTWVAVLVDAKTAQPVKMLPGEAIR
jgi:hypothetical protein